jgi:uncharacterized protein (DUF1015 family)
VAQVREFRALRYAPPLPLADLVAPPYDVLSAEERDGLRSRSEWNVVRLTLPESEAEAAAELDRWLEQGVLVEEEPAFWLVEQDYVGPDGAERTRTGVVGALHVEPYDKRIVLPHERTHAGPKEGRLRLLRATQTQLEPIFLLYDAPAFEAPHAEPEIRLEGVRLWKIVDPTVGQVFDDLQLLIADGHHRYETALAYHDEAGTPESAWMMVVLVSTSDPGLTIFPTHRIVERLGAVPGTPIEPPDEQLPGLVLYRDGAYTLVETGGGELDAEAVERLSPEGVTYTASRGEAVAAVDGGRAEAAFLVRAPAIQQVFDAAAAGKVMPQKTTYFFPKLLSGLLFQPL